MGYESLSTLVLRGIHRLAGRGIRGIAGLLGVDTDTDIAVGGFWDM